MWYKYTENKSLYSLYFHNSVSDRPKQGITLWNDARKLRDLHLTTSTFKHAIQLESTMILELKRNQCANGAYYTHVPAHTHSHTWMHSHTYTLSNTHSWIHTHTHTHTQTHTHTHTDKLTYTYSPSHSHAHTIAHTHSHSLSHARTHTNTPTHSHTHPLVLG